MSFIVLLVGSITSCKRKEHGLPPLTVEKFEAPTSAPIMSLLHGDILVVDMRGGDKITAKAVHEGTAYIIGQYLGNQDLMNSKNIILTNAQDFAPVKEFDFFSTYDKKKTGIISLEDMRKAKLVLAHYDTIGGYLEIQAPETMGIPINSIRYDENHNTFVLLQADGAIVFQGSIVNFKSDT